VRHTVVGMVMQPYDAVMRTTVDLPDDLHSVVSQLARDRRQSLSRTVSELVGDGLRARLVNPTFEIDPETGLPLLRFGRTITLEEVQAFLDEE
jgi:predicted transcriptional regulator